MRDALIALAWAGLSFNVLVALFVGAGAVFSWYSRRKSSSARAADVQETEQRRAQSEWNARKRRSEFVQKRKAHQSARANLAQFHRRGGNGAA